MAFNHQSYYLVYLFMSWCSSRYCIALYMWINGLLSIFQSSKSLDIGSPLNPGVNSGSGNIQPGAYFFSGVGDVSSQSHAPGEGQCNKVCEQQWWILSCNLFRFQTPASATLLQVIQLCWTTFVTVRKFWQTFSVIIIMRGNGIRA